MAKNFRPYPIIAGPTASGKTAVAVELAKRINGEVVSADSMQIYDGISVGTARPSVEEMQGVPHHLLGFLPLEEQYSVARYIEDANAVFSDIYARGKTPLMCGGTGLYIQSFAENIRFFEQETDHALRALLKDKAEKLGGEAMLEELRLIDSETAARLHANDLNRIVRALEVYYTTGQTISEQVRLSKSEPSPYTPCLFLLNYRDRSQLYERIDRRVDKMLQNGLLDEVRMVMGVAPSATVLQAIGYKELMPYVRGEITLECAVKQLKISTHHYAKRQISWF
ncbi:MAG: tRNA (adenosine(37)-N6)-dimethylallyltransferase MiaA, partial [Clostridia bacterium]|nr:tRNA (adenosine(37)-N6)-dimethylallyltransferase MiaA [Clostridia bacterium]